MNKIALITGAAGGVGRAVAERLAAEGWQLIVASRSGERLSASFGEHHLQVVADCTTVAGARQILRAAQDHEMLPTALAHCVGNIRLGAMHRMSEADFNDCLNANLIIRLCRRLARGAQCRCRRTGFIRRGTHWYPQS